jgi:hypothetical protein
MFNVLPYPLEEAKDSGKMKFYFESTGNKIITKVVEYSRLRNYHLGGLYNLGFGDLDPNTLKVLDDTNSNNGDMWPVASTVLSTIPTFFEDHPYDSIYVRGSDSGTKFEVSCWGNCSISTRPCKGKCRKSDQRITSYRRYLNSNYTQLTQLYVFSGFNAALELYLPYQKGTKYDAVIISKKF